MSELQSGIYHRPGQRPPASFLFLLLDVRGGASAASVSESLAGVVGLLGDLRTGRVRDLEGAGETERAGNRAQFEGLDFLVGYGRRLFDTKAHRPALTRLSRPPGLVYLDHPRPAFPSLPWHARAGVNAGESDLCIQLTADSQATTSLAAVEIWSLLSDDEHPLRMRAAFAGFGRQDGRGWLGFHDGVSNLESSQRQRAITAGDELPWMAGGSYLAFLRIAVDLTHWRSLSRTEQELAVGRDKLTGRPVIAVERSGSGEVTPVPAPGATGRSSDVARADYHDPPQTTEGLLETSHVHRANQNRASAAAPAGLRIFRQGYDFFEGFAEDPLVGLNFVSFQSDLLTLQSILNLDGWLGDVNFGGPAPKDGEPLKPTLLELTEGGFYAVPARATPFPGFELFA